MSSFITSTLSSNGLDIVGYFTICVTGEKRWCEENPKSRRIEFQFTRKLSGLLNNFTSKGKPFRRHIGLCEKTHSGSDNRVPSVNLVTPRLDLFTDKRSILQDGIPIT